MSKKKKKHSLRARIVTAITIVVTLSILAVSVAACLITMNLYGRQMSQIVSATLGEANVRLGDWLEQKKAFTSFIGQELTERGYLDDRERCFEFLLGCADRDPEIYDTYIGFSDSTCIFCSGWEPAPGEYDPLTRDWYKDAAALGGVIITDPYVDSETGRLVITCSTRLVQDGELRGVLAQDIFIDSIKNVVDNLHIDRTGYPILSTSDGTVIVHANPDYSMSVGADQNEVTHSITEALEGFPESVDGIVDLRDYSGAAVKYTELTEYLTGWRLGYALSAKEYNEEITTVVTTFLLLTVVFAVLIVIIVSLLLRRTFKPLAAVAEKSRAVSAGNLSVTFDYEEEDEIGVVCGAIEENNRVVKMYIDDIASRLSAIANGDFTRQSDVDYIGDYAPICRSLDKLGHALQVVFSGIDNASSAVFNGAGGVSSGSGQLSDSVVAQTGLIDEIVLDMKSLSEQIDQNVTRTDSARKTARQATASVQTGSEQMSDLLKAMREISDSSDKIKKIIGVIEDIAFQTDVLAINAAVEASRAGEAGRGFAVVAEQVRTLAGQSSEASDETKQLINRSAKMVNRGMELADNMAESLKDVVSETSEIDKLIVEINESSHEQRGCVDEVDGKIGRMSDYLSAASSTAEESAASSQELNQQAAILKRMLDDFRS